MALRLYRRHRKECEAGLPEDARTGQFEEGRRGWKKCDCVIHAAGTLDRKFSRRQTGSSDWEKASAVAAKWEEAGSWDRETEPSLPEPAPPPSTSSRMRIDEGIKTYLERREGDGIAPATLRKLKTFTKQLSAFAEENGYVMLDQFTSVDIDSFYSGLKLGVRTKGKRLETLRAFFRFCVNRKWLTESPVSGDLKPPLGASKVTNKVPFTDNEVDRIIAACDRLGKRRWGNEHGRGAWTGEDMKDFIWLSLHTALRISDVTLFNIERLQGNEVKLYAHKNGSDVFAYIPHWLRDRLEQRAKEHGPMLFLYNTSRRLETVTNNWPRRLQHVFELAGPFTERPTHHRFRHTFARRLLERGVPVADVAELLGDDEATVRKHYARWVPERQARLTKILKDALEDKPKGKLLMIPGGRS